MCAGRSENIFWFFVCVVVTRNKTCQSIFRENFDALKKSVDSFECLAKNYNEWKTETNLSRIRTPIRSTFHSLSFTKPNISTFLKNAPMTHTPASQLLYSMLLLLLLFWSFPASGATISLEAELGFYGHFQVHSWTPLTVLLENRGRAVNGTLEVIVTSGSELIGDIQSLTYTMDVELPYHAKKSAAFTVRLGAFIHPLRIRLRRQDEILAEQTINLRDSYTTKPFVVVADEKVSPDALTTFPESLFSTNVRPRFLPETWYGYDSVIMLFMEAEMLDALNNRQFEALTAWITQGGTLVMTGGMNYGVLSESRFKELLPLQALGSAQFQEIGAFQEFCGDPLRSETPFLVLNTRIPQAIVLVEEQETPIVLKKPVGNGQIIFLALDAQSPPFSRWRGRAAFWQRIVDAHLPEKTDVPRLAPEQILTALASHIPARLPAVSAFIAFFCGYLLIIKCLFWAFSKWTTRRFRFAALILAAVALFSAASYWVAADMLAHIRQTRNGLLHLHLPQQRHMASGAYMMGLHAMQTAPYTLVFPGQSHPLTAVFPKNAPHVPFHYHEMPAGQQISGTLEKWTQMFFALNMSAELPIRGQIIRDDTRLVLQAEQLTRFAIRGAYIALAGNAYAVGDLSGENVERICQPIEIGSAAKFLPTGSLETPAPTQTLSRFLYGKNDLNASQRATQEIIANKLMPLLIDASRSRGDAAYLMGWLSEPFIRPELHGERTPAPSLTLLTWEIPVEP